MNHFLTGTLCALLLATPLATSVSAATNPAASAAQTVNAFAFKAVPGLAGSSKEPRDFFFSPYSIVSALGMTWAGAAGDTKIDMANALAFDDSLHANLGALSSHLTSTMDGENGLPLLTTANRIWIAKDLIPKAAFSNILKKDYGAAASRVNFKEPEIAKLQINSWVEAQTQGHIRDLIQELTPDVRMVLTNAVYFKGAWENAFPEKNTAQEPFYTSAGRTVNVPMMKQVQELDYALVDGIKLVRLPYAGGADMLVALPDKNARLNTGDIIAALAAENGTALFGKWRSSLTAHMVNLWLPRFKMEETYELSEILAELGMEIAFGPQADFSAMAEDEDTPLHIDNVIHKTFVDVNERDTEAAAVTGVTMMRLTSVRPPLPKAEFHADRPFVFFILERQTNAILFMGHKSF